MTTTDLEHVRAENRDLRRGLSAIGAMVHQLLDRGHHHEAPERPDRDGHDRPPTHDR